MLIKIILLLALLASVAWFATQPSWESGAASFGALAAFLVVLFSDSVRAQSETLEADRQLFRSFLELLPSDHIVVFLRQHDFDGSFRLDNIVPLFNFAEGWNNPEHSFHNGALNKKLKRFHVTVEKFLMLTAANTSPSNVGIQSLNPYLRTNDPAGYKKIVKEMNDLADEVASQHEDFVMTARRKLRL